MTWTKLTLAWKDESRMWGPLAGVAYVCLLAGIKGPYCVTHMCNSKPGWVNGTILMPVLYNVLWVCNGVLLENLNLSQISMEEYDLIRMANADGLVLGCQGICCHHPDLYLDRKLSICRYIDIEVLLVLMVVWVVGISKSGYVHFWVFFTHMRIVTIETIWSNTT